MAVKGSGTQSRGSIGMPAMEDRTQTSPITPRSGAAKKYATSFPTKWGMKDQNAPKGVTSGLGSTPSVSMGSRGFTGAPDASSEDPLDVEPRKALRKQPIGAAKTPWGQTGAKSAGSTFSSDISGKVLGEAILSGSSKLPGSEQYSSSGPVRQPGK